MYWSQIEGILNTLYAYGDLAHIGGGFGKRNPLILPRTCGIWSLFSWSQLSKIQRSLGFYIQMGIGQAIQTAEEMNDVLHATILAQSDWYNKVVAEEYFKANAGATNKIIDYLVRS